MNGKNNLKKTKMKINNMKKVNKENLSEIVVKSPIGPILLRANDQALLFLDFTSHSVKDKTDHPILLKAKEELQLYFQGKLKKFSVKVSTEGTEFQKKVWKELQKIPFGKTLSYGELALKVGGKNYARAVGTAVGKNPLAIIIPCHRILAANGIGGFAGGLKIKRELLFLENHRSVYKKYFKNNKS